jgi:hypothetical protein
MLAQLLGKHGIGARVVPSEAVSVANLLRLDATGVQMACLSYLEPGSFTNPRYLVRRLRRRLPQAKIFAGFWTLMAQDGEERDALAATRADLIVISLRQAVEQVVNAAKEAASADLDGEIRAPAVAPLAAATSHSVAEFPVYSIDPSVPKLFMNKPTLEMPPAPLGRIRGFLRLYFDPTCRREVPQDIFWRKP